MTNLSPGGGEMIAADEAEVNARFVTFLKEASRRRNPTGTVLRFNGITWSRVPSPTTGLLDVVWHDGQGGLYVGSSACCGAGGVWKRGAFGAWTRLLAEAVADISGSGSHDVFFVGQRRAWRYDGATVHPREVVKRALQVNAAAVILAHNHPSGVAEPSQADEMITARVRDALALVDIRVLDHLIVGGTQVTSLAERGLI